MAKPISKIYLYALNTLGILILTCHFNIANGQSILMSSMGILPGTTNNASAIMFKSNNNCIDVQTGLTLFNRSTGSGEFDINCIVAQQFNILGMKLFPNPVVSNAKLKLNNLPGSSQDFTVSVWDNQGKLISNTKKVTPRHHDLSSLLGVLWIFFGPQMIIWNCNCCCANRCWPSLF